MTIRNSELCKLCDAILSRVQVFPAVGVKGVVYEIILYLYRIPILDILQMFFCDVFCVNHRLLKKVSTVLRLHNLNGGAVDMMLN